MSIDWSATGDMLSGIGTIGGALAVVVVAFFGRNALASFRAQKQTERQMEHAEKILAVAYELADALETIRHPMTSGHESDASKDDLEKRGQLEGLDDQRVKRAIQANVFYIRAKYFDELFDRASRLVPYAAAFFGPDLRSSLEDLIRNRHKVRVYADAYASDYGNDPDFDKQIRAAIWKGFGKAKEADEITESTNSSIAKLEGILFPIIRPPVAKQLNG